MFHLVVVSPLSCSELQLCVWVGARRDYQVAVTGEDRLAAHSVVLRCNVGGNSGMAIKISYRMHYKDRGRPGEKTKNKIPTEKAKHDSQFKF